MNSDWCFVKGQIQSREVATETLAAFPAFAVSKNLTFSWVLGT
jgi:hypothetical protein